MKKQVEEQKHFLALMNRPGDCAYIDVSKLDISHGYNPYFIEEIDSFTKAFTKVEIVNSIKRANLVNQNYFNGKLVVQDNQKHNPLEVIDKEFYNNFRIDLFLNEIMQDKVNLNNILNKFGSITKNKKIDEKFREVMKNNNLDLAIDILFNLPYLTFRKFLIYLLEKEQKLNINEILERKRDKAA